MTLENIIIQQVALAIEQLYSAKADLQQISIQPTRKEFSGDITLVVFPFLRLSKKTPELTAAEIGNYLKTNVDIVNNFNVIKGFLNIEIAPSFWLDALRKAFAEPNFGYQTANENSKTIVIEYSSPNTNKPLHLGHIRNNLLGYSVAEILKANGFNVKKVNLVNDRGIHICKSMLAWQKAGTNETPETSGKKGDHLVGEYYVAFDKMYKAQIEELVNSGMKEEEAKKKAPLILEAQEMLRQWEARQPETYHLWQTMNKWVYAGFDVTYKKLGVDFDKMYYESQTYLLGKENVMQGLEKKVLFQNEDSSIWIDLTADGLDQKLLLRSDGTSVYITQDIGTAIQRFSEFSFDKHIYVVGNEQDYHFKVLALILSKLGYNWANSLYHLSYGMVDLPSGKMKSREGTVVDADDLVDEMVNTSRKMSNELGKLDNMPADEADKIIHTIALGALKYFILKVDPKKRMLFNPEESIDFNGNTGPFIQYTYARIQSVLRKAAEQGIDVNGSIAPSVQPLEKETELLKYIYRFPLVVQEAGAEYSPALVANFVYEMVKEYNQFYHDFQILKEENAEVRHFRLTLSFTIAKIIKQGMRLLGIDVPERM